VIVSLQYLRAFAAMLVVAFHTCDKLATMDNANPSITFPVGPTGVDIFFVVSGFIIFVTAKQSGAGPWGFMRKRLIRVVPLYWVLTLFLAAVAVLKPELLVTAVFDFRHFVASLLFIPWPHPRAGAMLPLLIPGWTLNYEMAFYVMFAASLALPQSIRLWALLALLAGLAAIGLAMPLGGIMAFYTDPIILEFAAGLLIAKAWTSGVTVPVKAAGVATLLGFALLLAGSEMTLPRIVGAGIPAALIVAGAVFSESRYKRNPSRTLVLLGDASYSIYLSHVMVLSVIAKLWLAVGLDGGGLIGLAFVVVAMTASACAGVILYKLVERPLLQWLSGKKQGRTRPASEPGLEPAKLPGGSR
jgi:exopolysaccharide production protein ExoZ